MKQVFKKLVFAGLLLTAATMAAFAQNIEVTSENFPDENFRNWILTHPHPATVTVVDGVIYNIEGVKNMDIQGLNIADLTGVNYFTGLQWLICRNNKLISLDISNLELKFDGLDCDNQTPTITLIRNGDVYSVAIELNNPTGLASGITYADGKLTSNSNKIKNSPFEVDVVGRAAKLKGTITFKYAEACTGIAINGTTFPDVNFRTWALAQPWGTDACIADSEIADITYINVSGKGIQDLTGIDYFTRLEVLNCSNNQLTQLDVSNLENLETLNCDNQAQGFVLTGWNRTNVPAITNENRQIVGFYSIVGAKLTQKPQSGVYVVLYDNGETEVIAKK